MPALRQLQLMYALKQPKFINFDLKCLTVSYGLFCTLIIIAPVCKDVLSPFRGSPKKQLKVNRFPRIASRNLVLGN